MTPCFQIVKAIKNHAELLEEVDVKLSVLHIAMMRHYVYSRPELEHRLTSHLQQQQIKSKTQYSTEEQEMPFLPCSSTTQKENAMKTPPNTQCSASLSFCWS